MFRTIKRKCYLFFTILLLKRLMYTNSQISGSWNSILKNGIKNAFICTSISDTSQCSFCASQDRKQGQHFASEPQSAHAWHTHTFPKRRQEGEWNDWGGKVTHLLYRYVVITHTENPPFPTERTWKKPAGRSRAPLPKPKRDDPQIRSAHQKRAKK